MKKSIFISLVTLVVLSSCTINASNSSSSQYESSSSSSSLISSSLSSIDASSSSSFAETSSSSLSSSSQEGSSSSPNLSNSSSSSSSKEEILTPVSGALRLSQGGKAISSTESSLYTLYSIGEEQYKVTLGETYSLDEDYIEPEDVAAYFSIFNTWPQNYFESKSKAIAYGENGRLVSDWEYGSYGGSSDYTVNLGPWIKTGVTYYELDIGTPTTNSNYNNGEKITRGVYRIVALPKETVTTYKTGNSYDAVSFYTTDHYASFSEFYNRSGGWSSLFDGYKTGTGSRPAASTVEASL